MGFAFVTMDSGEEAQAAVDKFDTYVSCCDSVHFTQYILIRGFYKLVVRCSFFHYLDI